MPKKKLKKADVEDLIKSLPARDRDKIKAEELTVQWLEENIEQCKGLMKRDFWVGLPWFLSYTISLFTVGFNNITIAIFVIGVIYFVYTAFTTGTYGMNQRRVGVYEALLKKLK